MDDDSTSVDDVETDDDEKVESGGSERSCGNGGGRADWKRHNHDSLS